MMVKRLTKRLAFGLTAALAATWPLPAGAQIVIAAARGLGPAASEIVRAFGFYYGTHRDLNNRGNVSLIVKDAATIKSDITGNPATYDLFLSSSSDEPEELAKSNASLVAGKPFAYAVDSLELFSPSIDITAGLKYPLTTEFLIPDPDKDNYGEAVAQLLGSPPWNIPDSAIPGGYVVAVPSAGVVYAALGLGKHPFGFVARSQICTYANRGFSYPPGSYHHEYKPDDPAHPYDADLVTLTGIKLARSRSADQETELANFISFLTGAEDSYGDTPTDGTAILQNHCFRLPGHPGQDAADRGR
jgi:molybdate transport system substrate-binding protein